MAKVTLSDDKSKQASAKIKAGKGIEEILYFPKVPKDLDNIGDGDDNSNYVEQIWVLQGKRNELFKTEAKKYDDAVQKLTEAREKLANASSEDAITEAQTELEQAQDNMRSTLVKGFGKDNDEVVTPLPEGTGKQLIECVGFVNKRLYYISVKDLKKVEDAKERKTFRFNSDINKNLFESITETATDSSEGRTDDKLKTKFWDFQAKINKEWKFGDAQTEGQIKLKRLARLVPNEAIQDFLKTNTTCDIIDAFAKFLNDTANFSYQQKEQKRDDIIKLLEKKNEAKGAETPFTHYDWGRVVLGVQEIWGKTNGEFVRDFNLNRNKIPLEEATRKTIINELVNEPLPEVIFDTSGGAQFMRYSANCGGVANFDFANGKVSASYGAKAKLSLAEAGAEANLYFPNNNGVKFEFKVPVLKECFNTVLEQDESLTGPTPKFAHNSSFVLPTAIFDAGEQLQGIAIDQKNAPNNKQKEYLIQVAGHADTTGSNDYNKKIGYRRAKANHAFFTGDKAQWQEYFTRGFWGDEERDMIQLSLYMMKAYPKVFKQRFANMVMLDEDKFEDVLLRELQVACTAYNYPINKVKSASMREQLQNTLINDGTSGGSILSQAFITESINDANLISTYQNEMKAYLLNELRGIKENDFNLFYIDTELYPVLSFGEENLKVQQEGRVAANRRITLRLWQVKVDKQEDEAKINLGHGRLHIQGQVSCFVGATIGLSAGLDLNTYKGAAQLVGKKKKNDQVVTYKDKELKPDDKLAPGNATAKAEAFAGAKAEAALSAALEWNNPDKTTAGFGLLASVGGMVTGTAGAGIEGEFRIGFDQRSGTFQIKFKAQATWGLGCGGAWSLSVGVQQLYDFVVLVYHKLEENDFNFVDIFEDEKDSNGVRTESDINVYEVYIAWVAELWKQKDYFKAGVAVLSGVPAVQALTLLKSFNDLLDKYKKSKMNKEETQNIIYNILENSKMMTYTPPKAKGHMLYMLSRYKSSGFGEFINDLGALDDNVTAEKAAVLLIQSITHAREWKEVMEHMAVKTNDGKDYDPYDAQKSRAYIYSGNVLRMQHSIQFLRNELLNDYDDWKEVQTHLQKLKHWDKAWNKDIL